MYEISDFIEQYKVLEKWAYTKYDDGINALEQYHPDKRIQSDLTYFRKMRNVLSHNPNGTSRPLIELTDEFKERFESVCHKLMSNVSKIYIPYREIFKREMSDKVIPTISVMKERSFTHVPVMNGKKVWGVFSESAIFNIVGDGGTSLIEDDTPLFKIGKYITEYTNTGVFEFIDSNASIDDVCRIFADAFGKGRRLDVIYITTTGDNKGDLVGLVTIWDLSSLYN